MNKGQKLKLAGSLVVVGLIIVVVILFLVPNSPAQAVLMQFLEWLQQIPQIWGSILMVIIYAVAMVFMFPGTPFNLAAGFLFGIWIGSLVTVIGCDIGAMLSFILGRTLAKDWAENMTKKSNKFKALSIAIEKNGFLIIFLIRLSPIVPFGLCNYLFGVTPVTVFMYWASTTLGLIPGTVAYTYLGSLMRSLTDIYTEGEKQDNTQQTIMVIVASVVTVLVIVIVTVVTKRTLDKAMGPKDDSDELELIANMDTDPIYSVV